MKLPAGTVPPPKYHTLDDAKGDASAVAAGLTAQGYWLTPIGYNSYPYAGDGSTTVKPGDFSQTHVGDETDTSPYPDPTLMGISIEAYVRNMGILIRAIDPQRN